MSTALVNGRGKASRLAYRAKQYALRGHARRDAEHQKLMAKIHERYPELRQTAGDQASAGDGRHAVLFDASKILKMAFPEPK